MPSHQGTSIGMTSIGPMARPVITIIAAVASDGAIGRQGGLLFNVKADMRHFKETTMGHPVIMGRKTFESLPKGALPGRRNVIISRNASYTAERAETAMSLADAVSLCRESDEVFIIGGAQVYAEALPLADRLVLTRFDRTKPDADCYFPDIDPAEWRLSDRTAITMDERTGVGYAFETYERNKQYDETA